MNKIILREKWVSHKIRKVKSLVPYDPISLPKDISYRTKKKVSFLELDYNPMKASQSLF
jgi:hypothetical protein